MKKYLYSSFFILICFSLAGCLSVKYPQREKYSLKIHATKISARPLAQTLEIANVSIKPQFANSTFIYRTGDMNYISDYYNVFFNPPAEQISQLAEEYLEKSGIFSYVTDHYGYVKPDFVVQLDIQKLYADYRHSSYPKAVIVIRFAVVKKINHKNRVVLTKTYQQSIALQAKTSNSLVDGWSRGLSKILYRFSYDLKNLIHQMRGQQSTQHKTIFKK